MAVTKAQKAYGTTVSFDGVTIGELLSMSGTRTREMIDVFSCDSDDEAVERLVAGLDEGTPTMSFVYQPGNADNYDVINDKFQAGVKKTLLISGPTPAGASAPTLSAQAVITSCTLPQFGSAREVKTFDVGFTISGKWTYTDSSGVSVSASPSTSPSSSAS